jgi:hypothetical protein
VLHRSIEEREELRDVAKILDLALDPREQLTERSLRAPEHEQVQCHVAERELAPRRPQRHPRVASVEHEHAAEPHQEAEPRLPHGAPSIFVVVLLEERAVATEQPRPEIEEAHLLGVVLARHDHLEIALLPRLLRAPPERPKAVLGEAQLDDERRHRRGHHEEQRPRGELPEQHAIADQAQARAREVEEPRHERDRPIRRSLTRVRELVGDLRILEVRQLEPERLLEQLLVDLLREPRPQERVREPATPLDRLQHHHEPELREHPHHDRLDRRVREEDLREIVHDLFADPRDRGWQRAADERQQHEREREPRMKPRDQRDRPSRHHEVAPRPREPALRRLRRFPLRSSMRRHGAQSRRRSEASRATSSRGG